MKAADRATTNFPERWALIIQGLQNDVLSAEGRLFDRQLDRQLKERSVIENVASLARSVRRASGIVVHSLLTVERNGAGMLPNTPNFRNFLTRDALHKGSWGAAPDNRLLDTEDFVVEKMRVNPFYGSTLEPLLVASKTTHVVFAGTQTNMGVEHAVRHAADFGYDVFVAEDACAAGDIDAHAASLKYTIPRLATVTTVAELSGRIERAAAA